MRLSRLLPAVLLGAVLTPAPDPARLVDPDPSNPPPVAPARWPGFPLLPDGRFPIGAWCGPPARETTDLRYAECARAGINVTTGMLEDHYRPPESLRRLEMGRRHRVYAIVRDNRVDPDEARRPGWRADVDSMIGAYAGRSALLGYFLADEPGPELFASLGALNRRLAQRDPRHPGYVNVYGFAGGDSPYSGLCYTDFLRRFLREVRPAFFSFDSYSLLKGSDSPRYLATLDSTALISRETGVPYWAILQLTPHGTVRALTPAELAWQANLALAYGARGIMWFTYWTPNPAESLRYHGGPISYEGRRNPSYDQLVKLNPRLQALGKELSRMRPLGVRHVGTVPRGCTRYVDSAALRIHSTTPLAAGFYEGPGRRTYVLLVNRDYRRPTQVRLTTRSSYGTWDRGTGYYRSTRAGSSLRIEPGESRLVRLMDPTSVFH